MPYVHKCHKITANTLKSRLIAVKSKQKHPIVCASWKVRYVADQKTPFVNKLKAGSTAMRRGFVPFCKDVWAGLQTVGWVLAQALKPAAKLSWKGLSYWPFWRRAILHGSSVGFACATLLFFGMFGLTRAYSPDENADLASINRPPSITILDHKGETIGFRGSHYGDPLLLADLPDFVIASFVSTEDRRFYRHHGFDPRGFARAMWTNIRSGRLREGASTITQQLARNLFLSSDKTVNRKLQELQLAFWLEARYSKDEILSLYLNRIYLGSGTFGIEAAANFYFSKSAKDLTLSEAALLAGLPKAPSTLSPTSNFDGAAKRSLEVIDNLVETKVIDRTTAEIAKLSLPTLDVRKLNTDFGYFFDHTIIEASTLLDGISSDMVITTTLDTELQRQALEAVQTELTDKALELGAEQAALISYRNDGSILAMVGGRSYEESQFNRATQAERQPGSAFKPFVYLAALEDGMSPSTLFIDQPTEVGKWKPRNYSKLYKGPMRMTEAMAKSINSIAVQISETVGRDKVVAAAKRMGITHPLKEHPSLALGSMEVTLEEITSAYLPFARGGMSITPYSITRIENRQGELLYEYLPQPETQIVEPPINRDMTYLLHQVMLNGTGSRANLGRRQAAGKTGTTNDWRDAWLVGYTAQITTGVWIGNDENREMIKVTGGSIPAAIWRNYMLAAHKGLKNEPLPGARPAPSRSDELRLVEFYNGLQDDFRMAAYAETETTQSDQTWPNESGVIYEEYPTPPPKREERRRRRWWPFGGRG